MNRVNLQSCRRCALPLLLVVLAASCSPDTAPITGSLPPPPTTTPTGPARTYAFSHAGADSVNRYTTQSSFVLYGDGTFVLQFPSFEYRGRYAAVDGMNTLTWEGSSVAGPWGAVATIQGDSLTVRYNLIMRLTDFEDAVYLRQR